jgi:transposase
MSKNTLRILGILISERTKAATKVQEILTRYGCSIKTRLGLHEATDDICSPSGLILLELTGEEAEMDKLEKELINVNGVHVRKMEF